MKSARYLEADDALRSCLSEFFLCNGDICFRAGNDTLRGAVVICYPAVFQACFLYHLFDFFRREVEHCAHRRATGAIARLIHQTTTFCDQPEHVVEAYDAGLSESRPFAYREARGTGRLNTVFPCRERCRRLGRDHGDLRVFRLS